jgi:amidase/aspartyl-tRNA(Asn)/glutamyl-tRNA(Gln) amidotransferase subunit A
MNAQLSTMTAAEIAGLIRRRAVSPVEVMDETIAQIEARNPNLTALVFTAFDEARSRARAAEQAVMAGAALGPLHGVPVAIKDLLDFKPNWPATYGGVRGLKNRLANLYCVFAERIEKRGGAIIIGKTNSPTMGFRGTCDNYLFGCTRNPFDTTRNSGGSSGGSAAAVADGMLSIAEGTDAGGSIRIPASWCGVYGYMASFGRVPAVLRPNGFAGVTPFVFEGPITRTVEDAALALTALAGYDPRDPFSLDETLDFGAALRGAVEGRRIAYSPNLDVFPVEPEVADAVSKAVRAFEEAGARVDEVRIGLRLSQRELSDLWGRLMMPLNLSALEGLVAEGYDVFGELRRDFPPRYLEWIDRFRAMTERQLAADQVRRTEIYDAIQGVFSTHDLLVTPTVACLPVKNAADGDTVGPAEVAGEAVDPLIGWCLTYPFNFTGHPAASIPVGLSRDGLPIGMQIVGRRYSDLDVLTASAVFERLRPWFSTYSRCRDRPLSRRD